MHALPLYNKVSYRCSALLTRSYSTSFSLGILAFSGRQQQHVYAIYGFVRLADEIVDTFLSHNRAQLLERFKSETYNALDDRLSLNPLLQAFQLTVHACGIERPLIDAFLRSMEMDLHQSRFNHQEYDNYIYGSAEVIGLMCLRVFGLEDAGLYTRLEYPAMSLGAAFQKVNFLRDMRADFEERGRVYFPNVNYSTFNVADKTAIENDIERDFSAGLAGITQLPQPARTGVYIAYTYYSHLFKILKQATPETLKHERLRVPNGKKILLLGKALYESTFKLKKQPLHTV